MKKFLSIPIFALILSGCVATKQQSEEVPEVVSPAGEGSATQQASQRSDALGDVQASDAQVSEKESVINTDVAPLDTYASSDDVLKDVDAVMNELDVDAF